MIRATSVWPVHAALVVALSLACGGSEEAPRAASGGVETPPVLSPVAPGTSAVPDRPSLPATGVKGINIDPEATATVNILTGNNGVRPVAFSTAKTRLLTPDRARDLTVMTWGKWYEAPKGDDIPQAATFELPQTYRINKVGVRIGRTGHPYRFPKLLVEASTEGPDIGFVKLAEIPLEEVNNVEQSLGAPSTDARWLRYTWPEAMKKKPDAKPDGHGPDVYQFYAYGARVEDLAAQPVDLTGTWTATLHSNLGETGVACFEQTGTAVNGVLVMRGATWYLEYNGVIENRVLMMQTRVLTDEKAVRYPLTQGGIVIDAEGDSMLGVVPSDMANPLYVDGWQPWSFEKTSGDIQCKGFGRDVAAADAKSQVETDLEAGRAKIYGILFDFDKDTIKGEESKPVLDEVLEVMKKHTDWRFRIEGHTDSAGKDDYNLDLSSRRAASVVKWLTGAGIDAARLGSEGKGEAAPAASNETVPGRALNRRVEIVRL